MRVCYYISILLILSIFTACEKEKPLETSEPVVQILNYDGARLVQESGKEVIIDFLAQSVLGIKTLRINRNGEIFLDTVLQNQPLSFEYSMSYIIPGGLQDGELIEFQMQITDNADREAASDVFTIEVGKPFEIDEIELNGFQFRRLKGRLNEDLTMEANTRWLIDSIVFLEDGAVLTVEPGSTIYFRTSDDINFGSALIVNRNSKLIASGTRDQPIVFTSDRVLSGNPAIGDWGGIVLLGNAPSNQGTIVVEDGWRYGGTQPADNSGVLRFVRIEYSGKLEYHGLHLFGTGSGTLIEYVEVYENLNIAFRVKGGRTHLKYIAAINHGGYAIWAEHGWQGNGQFWLFQTSIPATLIPVNFWNQARSIEMRNDVNFFERAPRTMFRLSNITMIGNGNNGNLSDGTRRGVRIRRGAIGELQNMIITEFPGDGIRVEDLPLEVLGAQMKLDNTRVYSNLINWEQEAKSFFFESGQFNLLETPVSGVNKDEFAGTVPSSFNPQSWGPWFSPAAYIGAVDPGSDWTKGGTWFKDINGNFR